MEIGTLVMVNDPDYGPTPGRVVDSDEGGLYVEGPRLDSRVVAWSIPADDVARLVSPAPVVQPRHGWWCGH